MFLDDKNKEYSFLPKHVFQFNNSNSAKIGLAHVKL